MDKFDKKVWYLPGPYYRYEEDVKVLARKNNLRIVDSNAMRTPRDKWPDAADPKDLPNVTLKPQYAAAMRKDDTDAAAAAMAAAMNRGKKV